MRAQRENIIGYGHFMTGGEVDLQRSPRPCSECKLKPGHPKNLGLCTKCCYENKSWVRLQKKLQHCYRMHGFTRRRASRSEYLRVVEHYWSAQSVKQQKVVLAELVDHGYPLAAVDPFEALVDVLRKVLQRSPEANWQGESSQSVHTFGGGLPTLGRRA